MSGKEQSCGDRTGIYRVGHVVETLRGIDAEKWFPFGEAQDASVGALPSVEHTTQMGQTISGNFAVYEFEFEYTGPFGQHPYSFQNGG